MSSRKMREQIRLRRMEFDKRVEENRDKLKSLKLDDEKPKTKKNPATKKTTAKSKNTKPKSTSKKTTTKKKEK